MPLFEVHNPHKAVVIVKAKNEETALEIANEKFEFEGVSTATIDEVYACNDCVIAYFDNVR